MPTAARARNKVTKMTVYCPECNEIVTVKADMKLYPHGPLMKPCWMSGKTYTIRNI